MLRAAHTSALPHTHTLTHAGARHSHVIHSVSRSKTLPPGRQFIRSAEAVSAAAVTGDWQTALSQLEELSASAAPVHPRCFDDTILACARASPAQWKHALATLDRMRCGP